MSVPTTRASADASAERDARSIPGARESGMLTRFGAPAPHVPFVADGPSTMGAATIADRQREGGGAPSQRRLPSTTGGWADRVVRTWRSFLATTLAWPAPQPIAVIANRRTGRVAR